MLPSRALVAALPLARKALRLNSPCLSVISVRLAGHHGPPAHYRQPVMDELPVPCGSWQENYDNNQRQYNIHLLLGAGIFLISFAVGLFTGSFDLYLLAPEKPGPRRG